jgi:hypothetical protein
VTERLRLIVLGTLASCPYAGMAWMHMQIAAGLHRLGHDVYYFETTSTWPYDPLRQSRVCDSDYAAPYLDRVATGFGLAGRWAYRRSYSDKEWLGVSRRRAEDLLRTADAVFNVAGCTKVAEEGLEVGRLVYLGTDPVYHEVAYDQGDAEVREIVDEHDDVATYGENIGRRGCTVPPLPRLRAWTRQPVLLDVWAAAPPPRDEFTTVLNWRQTGREVELDGERYFWSKDRELLRFRDLPRRVNVPIEIATNLADVEREHGEGEAVPAQGVGTARALFERNGWRLVDAHAFTLDPWPYRDYVLRSKAEFTVARDLHVRLRSGWFSERSACYLAAGRPVVTQNTGFDAVLPTGEGLFAVDTLDEAAAGIEAIASDYDRHSRAAREIAHEYFRAETVLDALLADLGLYASRSANEWSAIDDRSTARRTDGAQSAASSRSRSAL